MKTSKIKTKKVDHGEVLVLAERVNLLFVLCGDLIPQKDLIKDTAKLASDRHSNSMAAAPILGAFGQDWEEIELDTRIKRDRADALYNLLDVLDRTEKDRATFAESKAKKRAGLTVLRKMLGN